MIAADTMSFSQHLKRFRELAGLTQAELAERAGISVKAISALESGRRQRPYPSTVRALADALQLSDDDRSVLSGSKPARPRRAATASTSPAPLPSPPAPIIGRERELQDVTALLTGDTVRVVTLTGPGGVGKTRLALELANRAASVGDRQVAFIPLSTLADATLVLPTIAQALGLAETADGPVSAQLATHLRTRPTLLVIDNLEHVIDASAELAGLLSGCPDLTILATSRASLRIRAEHEYPVRPLPLPELAQLPLVTDIENVASVRLFLERARAAAPDFELTQANCAAVSVICRRLDGLPLALELVAARVRVLSPTELLARLEHVLPLLVGGSRDLPQRQQTMQAAIDWSYELLDERDRALLRRLSIFSGGWSLEAAEAVGALDDLPVEEMLDRLTSLVEQSLVVTERDTNGATRYRLLETIRQFAAQRAEASNEAEAVAERHLNWCLAFAQAAARNLRGAEQRLWLDYLEVEHDNMRRALTWCQQRPDRKSTELQLATALWRFWETRGHITEGRRWLDHALSECGQAPQDLQAAALNAAGNLARDQGDQSRAEALHAASLEFRRELGDRLGVAQSLINLGNLMLDRGDYPRASERYTEALDLFRELDNAWDVANALNNLGIAAGHLGEYERAVALLEEALTLRTKLGENASLARTLDALGVVMQRQGSLERARQLHEQSLALRQDIGEPRGIAIALMNLGTAARYRGDYAVAGELIEESLRIRREVDDRFGIVVALSALADVARHGGDAARARTLYREALEAQLQFGINETLAANLLGLAALATDANVAAQLVGASDGLRGNGHRAMAPVERADYEHIVAMIRCRLTDEAFERAGVSGRALTLEQLAGIAGRE